MEGVGCLVVGLPIAKHRCVTTMSGNQVVSYDDEGNAGWADIFRSASIDDAVLGPVDSSGTEVGGHVSDKRLALRYLIVGEVVELESLDRLVVTVMEELRVWANVPFLMTGQSLVFICYVACNLVDAAVFGGLLDGELGPGSRVEVVRRLLLTIFKQVIADRRELHGSSALEHENLEIVGYR